MYYNVKNSNELQTYCSSSWASFDCALKKGFAQDRLLAEVETKIFLSTRIQMNFKHIAPPLGLEPRTL
ncbi:MAG TPA: hypothetical protein VFM70_10045 [Salinimicrobium sp.]|nr:hypothetical protein [Salinimicrobium sp.]